MARLRVLIVDDEQTVADTLSLIFGKRGYDCRVAYSADAGIACARSFHPQLLLSDLAMPGVGGLAMASVIAHEVPGCQVMLLTGEYGSLEAAWTLGGLLFGRHCVLTKPVHPETLLAEAGLLMAGADGLMTSRSAGLAASPSHAAV